MKYTLISWCLLFLCSCFRSLKKKKSVLFLSQQSYKLLQGLILDTFHTSFNTGLHHAIRFIQWFWSRFGFRVGVRIGLSLQVRMEVRVVFGVQGWNWSRVWIWVGVRVGVKKTSITFLCMIEVQLQLCSPLSRLTLVGDPGFDFFPRQQNF